MRSQYWLAYWLSFRIDHSCVICICTCVCEWWLRRFFLFFKVAWLHVVVVAMDADRLLETAAQLRPKRGPGRITMLRERGIFLAKQVSNARGNTLNKMLGTAAEAQHMYLNIEKSRAQQTSNCGSLAKTCRIRCQRVAAADGGNSAHTTSSSA